MQAGEGHVPGAAQAAWPVEMPLHDDSSLKVLGNPGPKVGTVLAPTWDSHFRF